MGRDKATSQMEDYAKSPTAKGNMTGSNGRPLESLTESMTAGAGGPITLQDYTLIDHLAHFDRERIPERVVHAKGAGAFGYFEVTTPELKSLCKAKMFSHVGKRTPVAIRFSTVGGESGSADTARDPRGFAVKFYSEEGNWDLVGNNTPVFFIRDPILFPSFIHTQKRNPKTHLKDADMFWDFISLRPESTHQVSILFSDRGTPDGYRHMNGYGSHTFKNVNEMGNAAWVKYHFKTDQGIRNLSASEAEALQGANPDYAIQDLYNAIAEGDSPSWTLYVQVMGLEEAARCSFNPFDVTKIWPHSEYPLRHDKYLRWVGRMVLNRNPTNYFAEVEQMAYAPSNMIPGIEPSPDKMLQGRLFSYNDTHRHRLGANYETLPVNRPFNCTVNPYSRDGPMRVDGNMSDAPNYFPNSFSGPAPADKSHTTWHAEKLEGEVARYPSGHEDNFSQANVTCVRVCMLHKQTGHFFRRVLDEGARQRLTDNIAGALVGAQEFIQKRAIANFAAADADYGRLISEKVKAITAASTDAGDDVDGPNGAMRPTPQPLNPPRTVPKPYAGVAAKARGGSSL
ncbi:unnamed protein product [Ascophyllum nodosum]